MAQITLCGLVGSRPGLCLGVFGTLDIIAAGDLGWMNSRHTACRPLMLLREPISCELLLRNKRHLVELALIMLRGLVSSCPCLCLGMFDILESFATGDLGLMNFRNVVTLLIFASLENTAAGSAFVLPIARCPSLVLLIGSTSCCLLSVIVDFFLHLIIPRPVFLGLVNAFIFHLLKFKVSP